MSNRIAGIDVHKKMLAVVGALIRITVRKVWVSLAGGYPHVELFRLHTFGFGANSTCTVSAQYSCERILPSFSSLVLFTFTLLFATVVLPANFSIAFASTDIT